MSKNSWRNGIDQVIEQNLKELIRETKEYDAEIRQARDKGKAQMWVAMAIINHKLNQMKFDGKKYDKKIPEKELKDIIETLEKL